MIPLVVGLALAEPDPTLADDPARAAEAAEARGDWAGALALWERCAAEGTGSTRRWCTTRATTLAPHAADGFAAWTELEDVRRTWRTIGSDAALARIEAALAANPTGPTAPELRVWLLNEYTRRGEHDKAAALRGVVAADPALAEPTRAWAGATGDERVRERRERIVAGIGATFAAIYVLVAARGPGPWKPRSAVAAVILLGLLPMVMGLLYEPVYGLGFGATGLVAALGVLAAARAPTWVAVPGTLGAMLAAAWLNDWFPSLGL